MISENDNEDEVEDKVQLIRTSWWGWSGVLVGVCVLCIYAGHLQR